MDTVVYEASYFIDAMSHGAEVLVLVILCMRFVRAYERKGEPSTTSLLGADVERLQNVIEGLERRVAEVEASEQFSTKLLLGRIRTKAHVR